MIYTNYDVHVGYILVDYNNRYIITEITECNNLNGIYENTRESVVIGPMSCVLGLLNDDTWQIEKGKEVYYEIY